jgi:hypothetical protein
MGTRIVPPLIAWSIIIVLSLWVLSMFFVTTPSFKKTIGVNDNEAILILDYGNGNVRKFKGPVDGKGTKAWNLLQQASAVSGINVEIADHFIPQNIDGFENGKDGKKWAFYINGERQTATPFEIEIGPGDKVVFRFE